MLDYNLILKGFALKLYQYAAILKFTNQLPVKRKFEKKMEKKMEKKKKKMMMMMNRSIYILVPEMNFGNLKN